MFGRAFRVVQIRLTIKIDWPHNLRFKSMISALQTHVAWSVASALACSARTASKYWQHMAVKLKPAAIRSRTLSAEHETSQSAAHELVSSRFHDKQSNTRCFLGAKPNWTQRTNSLRSWPLNLTSPTQPGENKIRWLQLIAFCNKRIKLCITWIRITHFISRYTYCTV